ncbi:uncharacterized protein Z519_00365 [Cladophialophora bantiana CBS 173.52]|uniref:Uncharacterized protein n=1 Tax=Cladophialophora bantiana (strain ATCC 10958 / CBS 173.52 / CDC B-1940 / NIH 8579) TaxID=1442370 RepID=A0A0D2IPH5_CLAB1|nr:uncharacterized protein Z519_00365 [Cladophialophora bantiana CBS 173.52]KIW98704.1 hypothetical protein Z519_00365 [Cladophialophora bantiana CBS 173.52]
MAETRLTFTCEYALMQFRGIESAHEQRHIVQVDRGNQNRTGDWFSQSSSKAAAFRQRRNHEWKKPRASMDIAISSSGRSQDRRGPSTELAVVAVTNARIPNDEEEVVEELARNLILSTAPHRAKKSAQTNVKGLGAIRAVQKKILKLADEATTATESAPNT